MARGQNKQSPCARDHVEETQLQQHQRARQRKKPARSELGRGGPRSVSTPRQSPDGAHAPVWSALAAARRREPLNTSGGFGGSFRVSPEITRGVLHSISSDRPKHKGCVSVVGAGRRLGRPPNTKQTTRRLDLIDAFNKCWEEI